MHRTRLARPHRTLTLALAAVLLAVPAAQAASSELVVSQVYAAGGNAGASFTNDYVELFNRGSTTVDLTGWSIQYATATGTSWSPTTLSGAVAPGRRYLVALGSGGTAGAALPAADATGTVNLAAGGGKVALVQDTAALTCGAAPGSCSAAAAVRDLVGYGSTASDYEGAAPAPGLTSSTALIRAADGCTDGNANDADFSTAPPTPGNSTAAATACGGASAASSQSANVAVDVQPVISLTLERPSVNFGAVVPGETPAPVTERVTVSSNGPTGYALSLHRTAFGPTDLPLGVSATAPAGTQLGPRLASGAVVAVPVPPTVDLLLGTSTAPNAPGGDVWPTTFAFLSPLAALPPGHYSASVTYTVIGQ